MRGIAKVRAGVGMRGVLIVVGALLASSGAALAQAVVFDQGPTTGTRTPAGPSAFVNRTTGQNFADNAMLTSPTMITAISIYTGIPPTAGTVHVKILGDNAGLPGSVLYGLVKTPDAWVADSPSGGYKVTVQLAPTFLAAAGTTYWYGVSGNGFELGQYGVRAPDDSRMAQFSGTTFQLLTDPIVVGDQMFQLEGAAATLVPATGTTGLIALVLLIALAGAFVIRRVF